MSTFCCEDYLPQKSRRKLAVFSCLTLSNRLISWDLNLCWNRKGVVFNLINFMHLLITLLEHFEKLAHEEILDISSLKWRDKKTNNLYASQTFFNLKCKSISKLSYLNSNSLKFHYGKSSMGNLSLQIVQKSVLH